MWDYDKLFTEGNIVGIKYINYIANDIIQQKIRWGINNETNWKIFWNNELKSGEAEIQYIIRIDEHGNIIEKLFDRNKDIIPKLEHGMFILVNSCFGQILGYIDTKLDKIIFQNGSWDKVSNISNWKTIEILAVYPSTLNSFDSCILDKAIWKNKKYN